MNRNRKKKIRLEDLAEIDKRIDELIDATGDELFASSKSTEEVLKETDEFIVEMLEEMEINGDFILDSQYDIDKPLDLELEDLEDLGLLKAMEKAEDTPSLTKDEALKLLDELDELPSKPA